MHIVSSKSFHGKVTEIMVTYSSGPASRGYVDLCFILVQLLN